jgi:dTDP-4-dehydrorhamnose reductase
MIRVLVTGAGGQLGRELTLAFGRRDSSFDVVGVTSSELNIADRTLVNSVVEGLRPDVVINSAAMTAVDRCETDADHAFLVNSLAVRYLVEACDRYGSQLVQISTDYVFDGASSTPYVEWDRTNPQSVYGRSKLGGEVELRRSDLCVRTAWVVGRFGSNMAKTVMRLGAGESPLRFVVDQVGSPTVASELAGTIVELVLYRCGGVFHVTGSGRGSWFDFAQTVMTAMGADRERVIPISTRDLPTERRAPRPSYSVLDNLALRLSGFELLPHWSESVEKLVRELCDDEL